MTSVTIYFLTICSKDRARVFLDEAIAKSTIDQFLIAATAEAFAVLAYCLMPDHLHLLVEGTTDQSNLRQFVKRAKQHSGAMFALANGRPLWQEGYFDRVLRAEEDARASLGTSSGIQYVPGSWPVQLDIPMWDRPPGGSKSFSKERRQTENTRRVLKDPAYI